MEKIRMPSLFRRSSRSKSPPLHEEEVEQQQQQKKKEKLASSGGGSPARTPEEEMERVFRKLDANGDGRFSRSELAALFESLCHAATDDELSHMMAVADADGDGFISLDEFAALNATASRDDAAVEEDLRLAFQVLDADGSGTISAAELARVLHGLGEKVTVQQCPITSPSHSLLSLPPFSHPASRPASLLPDDIELDASSMIGIGPAPPANKMVHALWGVSSLTLLVDVSTALYKAADGPVFGRFKVAYYTTLLAAILALVAFEMMITYWISRPAHSQRLLAYGKRLFRFAGGLLLVAAAVGGSTHLKL